ncbi:siderophore-interacting protein [Nocardiopsis gilva YIM 90087]|uniref:Siderophore-interacting protein n=1 Tax=Nocardiopsis gilva YIM 90087 TaxID=1235441 RepID=A0A223S6Z2_9ACTN|nr:siderophore-interacting protein [Nocardiopsis gilva]ASU83862.1 siderophore-interacting protein [Nocardiopsis gilva YIM 90087]
MAANWQRGVLRVMGVTNHPVTVTAVRDFTPWYRRITFSAPDFVSDLDVFPTLWLRLWVPNPARGDTYVSQRGYTLVDVRPDEGTFALDFVLHTTAGPAGDWAKQAAVGDVLEVALTPAKIALPPDTGQVLLAGDITALPAINSWLDAIPSDIPVQVVIEDGHDDTADLPRTVRNGSDAQTDWQWVAPSPERGAALADAVRASTRPMDGLYAWAAGERKLIKTLRPVLRGDLGLDRSRHFTQFYWIEGRSGG